MKKRFVLFLASFLASNPITVSNFLAQEKSRSIPVPSQKQRATVMENYFLGISFAPYDRRHKSQKRETGGIEFRSIDGQQNNLRHVNWGSAEVPLLRYARPDYFDEKSQPSGSNRPSAREISNLIAAQSISIENDRNLSSMVWQWGQFIDHDIDLTENHDPAEPFFIEVPAGDPFFDPANTGAGLIFLFRSHYDELTGIVSAREQVNSITAWIDGSQVYGSDEQTASTLRAFESGRMKTSSGNMLPQDASGFFTAGDVRANEQVGLTAMHTLFVREHNRIAANIADGNSSLSDEEVYLMARREVIAIIQAITYREFLPALLGETAVAGYRGYNPRVNPGIANEFSTSAFRLGHSMLNTDLLRLDDNGRTLDGGNLPLREAFFNPQHILNDGIEPYLKGLTVQRSQELDNFIVDDVRNFLFGEAGSGGFDLAALNIQRGRDHGLCDYNTMRSEYGMHALNTFDQITSDPLSQLALIAASDGDIDNIDSWVGLLAEDHDKGCSVGPTMKKILSRQFEAIRDGDRFWFERNLKGGDLERVKNTRLSDVIKRNTSLRNVQENVFFAQSKSDNRPKKRPRR